MRYTLLASNWFADTLHCFHSFNQFISLIEFTTILHAMLNKTPLMYMDRVYGSCTHKTSWIWEWMRFCVIITFFSSTLGHCVTMIELFGKLFLSIHWLPSIGIHSILKFETHVADCWRILGCKWISNLELFSDYRERCKLDKLFHFVCKLFYDR